MARERLSYEDSVRRLQKDYLGSDSIPPMLGRMPRYDDEEPRVSFFKTFVGDGDDLSNLTLPHTFFGRSEVNNALFCNTDFAESCLCWNDFVDVDFSDAVLARSDMRASRFTRVKFVRTDLRNADMRRSTFKQCLFDDAIMDNAVLTYVQSWLLPLSRNQRKVLGRTFDPGSEPGGG